MIRHDRDATVRVEAWPAAKRSYEEYYDVEGAADPDSYHDPQVVVGTLQSLRLAGQAQDKTAQESHEVGHSEETEMAPFA